MFACGATIRHNRIYAFRTVDGKHGNSAITNPKTADGGAAGILIRVIGNHFSTRFSGKVGAFGPWLDCVDETQVTGNVYHESRKPVPA